MTAPPYAVIVVWPPGMDAGTFLAAGRPGHEKIIVFDTADIARHCLPRLGGGRITRWRFGGEIAYFEPMDVNGVNRAAIITPYDVYQLPAYTRNGERFPARSEAKGRSPHGQVTRGWKHHVIWTAVEKIILPGGKVEIVLRGED